MMNPIGTALLAYFHRSVALATSAAPAVAPAVAPVADSATGFPDGEHIYQGDSWTPITPSSAEGQTILAIYARQDADRQANAAQKAFFAALQQTRIPQSALAPGHLNSSGTPVFSEQFDNPDYPRTAAERAADKQTILDNTIEFVGAPSDPAGFAPGTINPYNRTSRVARQVESASPVYLGPGLTLADLTHQRTSA